MDQNEYLARGELNAYLNEASKIPFLSISEELELGRRKNAGDIKARNDLVSANLLFVHNVGRPYFGFVDHPLEIMLAGNEGLIKAADNFDPNRKRKLVTYAYWEIRRSIFDYLAKNIDFAKLPKGQIRLRVLVSGAVDHWRENYGYFPSPEEIKDYLKEHHKDGPYSVSNINRVLVSGGLEVTSLDKKVGGTGRSLSDILSGSNGLSVVNSLGDESVGEILSEVLDGFNERDKEIFLMYELDNMFFREIGSIFGITRERARQIHHSVRGKAKKRLRWNPAFRELGMDYLFDQ
ncbi:MAG: sigma-70 family RNA polymerase sigma factor [Nanoarchaeota archaeon]|nr:sigma-70 family RNA polymerase sigma factor [Nanoarchaeota archaeon]